MERLTFNLSEYSRCGSFSDGKRVKWNFRQGKLDSQFETFGSRGIIMIQGLVPKIGSSKLDWQLPLFPNEMKGERLLKSVTAWKKLFLTSVFGGMLLFSPLSASAETKVSSDTSIGQELHLPVYQWVDDTVPEKKGVIFTIHGATLYARRFESLAQHLAQAGYIIYGLDLRGFGQWRNHSAMFGGDSKIHYTQSQSDIVRVLEVLRKQYPNERIYALGESLGANLSVWVASEHPQLVDGLILSSPCIKPIWHARPRLAVDIVRGVIAPHREMRLDSYIKPYLAEDKRVAVQYLRDPMICKRFSAVDLIKSLKTNTLALSQPEKIPSDMPILIVAGKKDKIYKASAIPAFASKIGSQQKAVYIVPGKGHLLLEHPFLDKRIVGIIDTWLAQNEGERFITTAVKATVTAAKSQEDIDHLGRQNLPNPMSR